MKRLVNYFGLVLALCVFASCEDPIQIKLDEGEKLLVVDAFVNDLRTDQFVRLTYSDSYFSGKNPPVISGASVMIKDLTANKTYNFIYTENGKYVYSLASTDTIAYKDHQYQLEVNFDQHTYTAITTQKRTTQIDSISVKYEPGSGFFDEGYYCTMWAFDAVGPEQDYYWVKSYRNDSIFGKGGQINIAIDAANGSGTDGFLFIPPIAQGITPFGERFWPGNTCKVEIHSISKETYYFLRQVQTQTTNSGLFATTPENVRTNISAPADAKTRAIGWFNMASVSTMTRSIP